MPERNILERLMDLAILWAKTLVSTEYKARTHT
jgi:hypothetical protein